MNYQTKVRAFQIASGQPVSTTRRGLNVSEFDFRENLFLEETKEFTDAYFDGDRVEMLDGLCDIKYVTDGVANMTGIFIDDEYFKNSYDSKPNPESITSWIEMLQSCDCDDVIKINLCVYELASALGFSLENFTKALDRVHESNMSKFCLDLKTADETKDFYAKQGIETYIMPVDKVMVVYRESDGKVLKSVQYHPVQLKDLV